MKIIFSLHYVTEWGENLYLTGSAQRLGAWDTSRAVPLQYTQDGLWQVTLDVDTLDGDYAYFIYDSRSGRTLKESGPTRRFSLPEKAHFVSLQDSWQPSPNPEAKVLESSFFDLLRARKPTEQTRNKNETLIFEIAEPRLLPELYLGIVGDCPTLGRWKKPLLCEDSQFPIWSLSLSKLETCFYKCVICREDGSIVQWEEGPNRRFEALASQDFVKIQITAPRFQFTPWKGCGLTIPLFSLRSERGVGIGEFTDLSLLAKWASKMGLKVIQILPLNDTSITSTWTDSYPYATLSVFALHPIYLNLQTLGKIPKTTAETLEEARIHFNGQCQVDYEGVLSTKLRCLREIYHAQKEESDKLPDYLHFKEKHREWLAPYCLFCALRDAHQSSQFELWDNYRTWDMAKHLLQETLWQEKCDFYAFLQYHLHTQLSDAVKTADRFGIAFKADLPIGVHPWSVDVWVNPDLFKQNLSIGAPPDPFSDEGQNWGFPAFRWNRLLQTTWFEKRLQHMAQYFKAFRIDHILGYFRIWEIPRTQISGVMGMFSPALPLLRAELKTDGLTDIERYTKPYITQDEIEALALDQSVKQLCFTHDSQGRLLFKTDSQKELLQWLPKECPQALKNHLLRLITSCILLKDPEGAGYHPRISLQHTSSFKHLPSSTQQKFLALADDFFYRRHETLWRNEGLLRLPKLQAATRMLVCGEDLGMVPQCVAPVMKELGILSLKVQRMPSGPLKEWEDPASYPYLCVATTSTHDTSTLRAWWQEEASLTQRYWNGFLKKQGVAPSSLEPDTAKEILTRHLASPAMLTIFPLQDLLAIDPLLRHPNPEFERINEPDNPQHYWRYRLHRTLEDLNEQSSFNEEVKRLVQESGR